MHERVIREIEGRKGLAIMRILLVALALLLLALLYSMASTLVHEVEPKQHDIVGGKNYALSMLSFLVSECWTRHAGSSEGVVCYEEKADVVEDIKPQDVQTAVASRNYPNPPGPPCLGRVDEINKTTKKVIIQYSKGCIDVLAIRQE